MTNFKTQEQFEEEQEYKKLLEREYLEWEKLEAKEWIKEQEYHEWLESDD